MTKQPRILVLGLGGTGVEAILQLKLLFGAEAPPHIGLFGIDTEAPKEVANVSLHDFEFARLVVSDLTETLRNPENAHMLEWFPEISFVGIHSLIHGAAQIRLLGRLALHAQADYVLKQLRKCLSELTARSRLREIGKSESIDDQGSIEVYVLASLCGGTGSGITLDVTNLVRQELRDAPGVRVYGVLLLPAFVEHDGYQCGYCTSGQIMSAVALLKEPIGPTDEDIKHAMAGNICRCGAYTNIVAAVRQVRQAKA
jgi:hypothetical protein